MCFMNCPFENRDGDCTRTYHRMGGKLHVPPCPDEICADCGYEECECPEHLANEAEYKSDTMDYVNPVHRQTFKDVLGDRIGVSAKKGGVYHGRQVF